MLELEYIVGRSGWANAKVSNGKESVEARVSYLHDTLGQLAESTLQLLAGSAEVSVVFMDEPGEYQLKLKKVDDSNIEYQVLWYDDWESWGMYPSDKSEEEFSGSSTIEEFRHQVTMILKDIYENIGEEKYKELWIEHDFPTKQFKEINAA